jgi:predicted aspartyl protease
MMQGYVNTAYEAILTIVVSHRGKFTSVNAVIDTGFTGFLSLPPHIITELNYRGVTVILAPWVMVVKRFLTFMRQV